MNFTHFYQVRELPQDTKDLENYLCRRMAIYLPDNSEGLGLLIPIKKVDEYGTLQIQVKNYSSKISVGEPNKSLKKLLPSKCPPYVSEDIFSVSLLVSVNEINGCCNLIYGGNYERKRPSGVSDSRSQKNLEG